MKKIIKLFSITVLICLVFCNAFALSACKKENPLYSAVSELRCDVFEGKSENFNLIACYGFKETPFNNDGESGKKVYSLTFSLLDKEIEGATFTLTLEHNGEKYSSAFKLNPVTHKVNLSFELDNFNQKEFSVVVSTASLSESVKLTSTVPKNTLSYKSALDHLYAEQKQLINAYSDENGNFNAEIYARIVIKNQKPYWYIGIASGSGNLKALLVDGFSGEVLAIRDIF